MPSLPHQAAGLVHVRRWHAFAQAAASQTVRFPLDPNLDSAAVGGQHGWPQMCVWGGGGGGGGGGRQQPVIEEGLHGSVGQLSY